MRLQLQGSRRRADGECEGAHVDPTFLPFESSLPSPRFCVRDIDVVRCSLVAMLVKISQTSGLVPNFPAEFAGYEEGKFQCKAMKDTQAMKVDSSLKGKAKAKAKATRELAKAEKDQTGEARPQLGNWQR